MEARRVSEGVPIASEEESAAPPLPRRRPRLRSGLPLGLLLLAGCGENASQPPAAPPPAANPVTWIEQDIEHEGMKISLGHRGQEPVAAITRDGQPVANAMVFCTLLSAGGEVATVYESPAGTEPGLYAPGSQQLQIRFRIVLPEVEKEWTREIAIPLK